jgi:radical SAM family uncharacterized protein/radical SAM-linked protein
MKNLIEERFLPFVIKPGRYAGGEMGTVTKDPAGRTAYLHAYPDKYEVGQSHIGLQSLYHVVNADDRFLCERVFAPDIDAEKLLRELDLPLFSLESRRAATEFDAFGFSLVDEANYTNMLAMLELAHIPLRSSERDNSHPIILAGGPAVFNPEPIAPFVDCFFVGDAEIGLPEILTVLHDNREADRATKLALLCRNVESVYIPCFYDDRQQPRTDFAPVEIKARIVPELKAEYYPKEPIVPLIETAHNHLGVEIMRGCPQGCRYCMAGPIYKPVRHRPMYDILQQVDQQLRFSGYSDVTLLSLSASDYPEIESLATTLARRLEPQRISLGLPSLRPGTISPGLLGAVTRVRVGSLTIAPEAGTERLRLLLRKDFPDAAIYDTARLAFEKGISSLKLYFMIGLPSETEEDLLGIVDMVRTIQHISHDYPDRQSITVTLSPFIPKAHTPFQWDEALPEAEMFERLQFIKRKCRMPNVTVRHNNTHLAQLMVTLGRGGREMAAVIETAYRNGCRFDGWSEHFLWETWQEAFKSVGVDPERTRRAMPFDAPLPWAHIHKGPSVDHLKKERHQTSFKLRDYIPRAGSEIDSESDTERGMSYGRGKKKVAGRASVTPIRSRVRIKWGRSARYRYISHLDNLRLMERLVRIANLPIAYSQGFNPTMKLSFGPPLSVGFTSEAEFVDMVLEQPFMNYMLEQLQRALPQGLAIYESGTVLTKNASLSALLNRADYSLPLTCWTDPKALQAQIDTFLANPAYPLERPGKQGARTVDIRPAVFDLRLDEDRLTLCLGIGEGGYAKPTEVVEALRENLRMPPAALPFHRTALYRVDDRGERIDGMQL